MKTGSLVYLAGGSLVSLLLGIIVTIIIPAEDPIGPSSLARPYTEQELRGRAIYLREGCHYCHTQQVRAPEANQGRVHQPGDIGPESVPGDYYYQSPVFWGTQRQGPDLAHVASRSPLGDNAAWHLAHFRDPRSVSPGSVMPSFDFLSAAELEALTAYILTLK
jgi:cytochrome c oxidase cbb3-type subunit 2